MTSDNIGKRLVRWILPNQSSSRKLIAKLSDSLILIPLLGRWGWKWRLAEVKHSLGRASVLLPFIGDSELVFGAVRNIFCRCTESLPHYANENVVRANLTVDHWLGASTHTGVCS